LVADPLVAGPNPVWTGPVTLGRSEAMPVNAALMVWKLIRIAALQLDDCRDFPAIHQAIPMER
jgi:hypothetical protein